MRGVNTGMNQALLAATHLLLSKVCAKGRERETLITLPPHISQWLLCPFCLFMSLHSFSSLFITSAHPFAWH